MFAGFYEEVGRADQVIKIGEMEDPIPGPYEVLVKIAFSGINPSDVKMRAGSRGVLAFPRIIPHSDGSGIIESVGSMIDRRRIGEKVWIWNGNWKRAYGTNAEYIAIPSRQAVKLPEEISLEVGATLGIPAITAHYCLFSDGSIKDKIILITGGGGRVGSYAIQMACLSGAKVITTVSSEEKATVARENGAHWVINYKKDLVIEKINTITNGNGVDRIIEVDFGSNIMISKEVLKKYGTIAAYGSTINPTPNIPFYPMMFLNHSIKLAFVYEIIKSERDNAIQDITCWLKGNKLKSLVTSVFVLSETSKAHNLVEVGKKIGGVLVKISD